MGSSKGGKKKAGATSQDAAIAERLQRSYIDESSNRGTVDTWETVRGGGTVSKLTGISDKHGEGPWL